MRNKCANSAKKLLVHIWILISWLINAVCGIVLFKYRNDSEKTAITILKEKLLISLSNLLAILNVQICCKMPNNMTNNDSIEEGKNLLNLINSSDIIFEKLKGLAANGNQEAKNLLESLNSAGLTMVNNLILIKDYKK